MLLNGRQKETEKWNKSKDSGMSYQNQDEEYIYMQLF